MAVAQTTTQPSFSALANRVGIPLALQIFLGRNATPFQRALAYTNIARAGASTLPGAVGRVAGQLGPALGAGSTAYDIYRLARARDLSTKQKAGAGAGRAADYVASAVVPYYGLALAARAVINQLQRSGSPQVRQTGNVLAAPALPVEALRSVIEGRKSPRASMNEVMQQVRNTWGAKQLFGPIMDVFGIATPKSGGTQFRNLLGKAIDPRLSSGSWKAPEGGVTPEAARLGTLLAYATPKGKKRPERWSNVAANILQNTYGTSLPGRMPGIARRLGVPYYQYNQLMSSLPTELPAYKVG
jgi:hypothetical protein